MPVRPLTAPDAVVVPELVSAAAAADGVGPLSEDAVLRLRAALPGPGAVPGELARGVVHLVATAGGSPTGYAQVTAGAPGTAAGGELLVHPAHRRAGAGRALLRAARAAAGGPLLVWAHGDTAGARALAVSEGARRVRDLWHMRRPLPPSGPELPEVGPPAGTRLRAFRPGLDEAAWLALNAAAFADHPEQGRWGPADLAARQGEPWFDAAGFLLAEADGGRLVGFHWTKVEPGSDTGEVYVLGVDPGRAGRGLGRALAVAGLRHLAGRVAAAELYVDGGNTAGVRLYTRLGFTRTSLDVQYLLP
ncbi:mycothiol synthase [Kineococcus sp. NUM-3379]